ncbi:tRNA (guanine(6)-N2)-methyltransferase THUMP3 [Salminus brasiliensis]|uniref:tRNA (guanine(6)-N2)-methyltransferase THUMP3 n=1 Tax=Salminus brasiliensis TaxID=930266 RepID=UPI003B836204
MNEGSGTVEYAQEGEEVPQPFSVTVGATVPTGFEHTAAEEVHEKIGAVARVSKDRGRIYFEISTDNLPKVHHLKSVDNLFVVVEYFDSYEFKGTKEEALLDLQQLASTLPWTNALEVWKLNNSLKKKRSRRRGPANSKPKPSGDSSEPEKLQAGSDAPQEKEEQGDACPEQETSLQGEQDLESQEQTENKPLKFRVTCNRAGDKHSFTSNDAARDFGGAVQEFFQWKADMTKFDVEVLLNIHNNEVVIGIALTEESLHRRNITHFGPTTLRSTLAYGMLRLCKPQTSDVIVDPMCGTGAIPLEGVIEWSNSFFLSGDNHDMAVSRTVNNINHIVKRRQDGGSTSPGLRIDTAQWDLCRLPMRTSSVDIITTDMPFGKRMGSKKKNWDLYPSCLREMARVCRPGTGRAVILTQDKKCFQKALFRMGGLWKKSHTVWVNVGGLHAGVFVLRRTGAIFGTTPEDEREPRKAAESQEEGMQEKV